MADAPTYVVREGRPEVHELQPFDGSVSTCCDRIVRSVFPAGAGRTWLPGYREATAEEVATGAPCVMCERKQAASRTVEVDESEIPY